MEENVTSKLKQKGIDINEVGMTIRAYMRNSIFVYDVNATFKVVQEEMVKS